MKVEDIILESRQDFEVFRRKMEEFSDMSTSSKIVTLDRIFQNELVPRFKNLFPEIYHPDMDVVDMYRYLVQTNRVETSVLSKDISYWNREIKDAVRFNEDGRFKVITSFMLRVKKNLELLESKKEDQQAENIYEDSNVKILRVDNHTASCKYGAGTKWCSTRVADFNMMNEEGSFYYFVSKIHSPSDSYHRLAMYVSWVSPGYDDYRDAVNADIKGHIRSILEEEFDLDSDYIMNLIYDDVEREKREIE